MLKKASHQHLWDNLQDHLENNLNHSVSAIYIFYLREVLELYINLTFYGSKHLQQNYSTGIYLETAWMFSLSQNFAPLNYLAQRMESATVWLNFVNRCLINFIVSQNIPRVLLILYCCDLLQLFWKQPCE